MAEQDPIVTSKDLPIRFTAKYLGCEPAKGLWGMKHTRKPVDTLVMKAKNLPPNVVLPIVTMEVSKDGLSITEIKKKKEKPSTTVFKVETISYGVQDLVYTRVFSMIVVTNLNAADGVAFECHSFVCESRNHARQVTYALSAAFQEYGKRLKAENPTQEPKKRFAIDLRTPEQQAAAEDEEETEA